MKKSRYTDSQIIAILNQGEAGTPVADLCREHGTSSATFYKWRAKYGGTDASLMARFKELAKQVAACRGLGVRLTCRIYGISEACYRHQPKLSDENAEIADWLGQPNVATPVNRAPL